MSIVRASVERSHGTPPLNRRGTEPTRVTPDDDTLAVYSDFVCPFCYLGRAALREYLADAADPPTVEWRLFDLRGYKRAPDGELSEDVDDGKDDDYFEQVRENVARLREKYDVEMRDFDDLPEVDSWDTQQAALYVRRRTTRSGSTPSTTP